MTIEGGPRFSCFPRTAGCGPQPTKTFFTIAVSRGVRARLHGLRTVKAPRASIQKYEENNRAFLKPGNETAWLFPSCFSTQNGPPGHSGGPPPEGGKRSVRSRARLKNQSSAAETKRHFVDASPSHRQRAFRQPFGREARKPLGIRVGHAAPGHARLRHASERGVGLSGTGASTMASRALPI